MSRYRVSLIVWLFLIAFLGYWFRFDAPIAAGWRDRIGGAAYVIFFVVAFAAITRASSAERLTLLVLTLTCALEFLQLWHPPWLERIRRTLPGRALLGTTFEWADFPPYFVGAVMGWVLVRLHRRIFSIRIKNRRCSSAYFK